MWASSLLFAGSLLVGSPVAFPIAMPQACFVFGEVLWSPTQTTAMLSSNYPIQIGQQGGIIVMKGQRRMVNVAIPKDPGLHEFVYRWGESFARFDDEKVRVGFGPLAVEQAPSPAVAPESKGTGSLSPGTKACPTGETACPGMPGAGRVQCRLGAGGCNENSGRAGAMEGEVSQPEPSVEQPVGNRS